VKTAACTLTLTPTTYAKNSVLHSYSHNLRPHRPHPTACDNFATNSGYSYFVLYVHVISQLFIFFYTSRALRESIMGGHSIPSDLQ
jgi:hypothetical protein